MPKWLPYVLVAALGLGLGVLMLMPGTSTTGGGPSEAAVPIAKAPATAAPVEPGEPAAEEPVAANRGEAPAPGTLRPLNEAETAQKSREARPFNAHTNRVQTYWQRAGGLLSPVDAALGQEASAMKTYVREQARLNDDEVVVEEVLRKELALVTKIRATPHGKGEIAGVLDYIEASANAVLQGGDPAAVPAPTAK